MKAGLGEHARGEGQGERKNRACIEGQRKATSAASNRVGDGGIDHCPGFELRQPSTYEVEAYMPRPVVSVRPSDAFPGEVEGDVGHPSSVSRLLSESFSTT